MGLPVTWRQRRSKTTRSQRKWKSCPPREQSSTTHSAAAGPTGLGQPCQPEPSSCPVPTVGLQRVIARAWIKCCWSSSIKIASPGVLAQFRGQQAGFPPRPQASLTKPQCLADRAFSAFSSAHKPQESRTRTAAVPSPCRPAWGPQCGS